VASKKTLNAKNLEALGASRLSELMIEITKGDTEAKRRLRLELAGEQGAGAVASEIRKRIATIARSNSFIEWDNIKKLVRDLELQRTSIVSLVARDDPVEALELMWRFIALASSVFERCDDGSGRVIEVFHAAVYDIDELTFNASPDPKVLADQVLTALMENDYGQYDYLIASTTDALGDDGLEHLKQSLLSLSNEPKPKLKMKDREVIGFGSNGPVFADDYSEERTERVIKLALQEIADAQGDVDAFIAQKSKKASTVPTVATEIAGRLLAAGRIEEAWTAINAVDEDRRGWIPLEYEMMKVDILEALERGEEAKKFQWACFERSLHPDHLRAYLKRLPDFEDMDVEEKALGHALSFPNIHQSLLFLINWPSLEKAAELVLARADELDGYHYELLTPTADMFEAKFPLVSTLLRRALINFALDKARSKRYRYAAGHLHECGNLAGSINDFGSFETHEAYKLRLKKEHGRKSGFWGLVKP
jgi:hypothetical protein